MVSIRYSALIFITFFVVFGQVSSVFDGFGLFPGDKDKDKKKDGDKDQNKGSPFSFLAPNETARREEGLKRIHYSLLDRKNQSWVAMKNDSTVPEDLWHDDKPLKLLIHSYSKDTLFTPGQILAKQNILQIGSAYGNNTPRSNVMIVDWTSIAVASEYEYEYVVKSTPAVGKVVADYLLRLVKDEYLTNMKFVHIIGYGVGAHVAGIVGKLVKKKKKTDKIGRITGVDPAGVGFDDEKGEKPKNKSVSLDKYDARFVDIIHCSMGAAKNYQDAKFKGRFGSKIAAGHIDFYPNGGTDQTSCEQVNKNMFAEKDCNTLQCPKYFENSVVGFEYVGCKCSDYEEFENGDCKCTLDDAGVMMGESCKKNAKGKYFLKITGTEKKPDKPHKAKKFKKKVVKKKVTTTTGASTLSSPTTKVPKKKTTTATPAPTGSSTTRATTTTTTTTAATTTTTTAATSTTAITSTNVSPTGEATKIDNEIVKDDATKLAQIETEETDEEDDDDEEGDEDGAAAKGGDESQEGE